MTTMNPLFLCPITHEVMTDPVSDNDGISYERNAILEWLSRGNTTSPVSRRPLSPADLRPNLALRALIEESGGGSNAAADPQPTTTTVGPKPDPIHVSVNRVRGHPNTYHVQLSTPHIQGATIPTEIIKVLDNSGSMSLSSVDETRNKTDAAIFSRSNLVEHSTATAIELTEAPHRLGVVVFNDNARIALDPTPMDRTGKMVAKSILNQIRPGGGTNIWAGLHKALKAAEVSPCTNIAIILQTDGESDPSLNPPRGIPDTLRTWLDTNPATAARVTIHTIGYGFGRALDMPLLRQIAAIGKGTVSYIPDGSMVGTVFIHMLANLLSCAYRGVRIQVPEEAMTIPVGFLQGDQTRDFIIKTAEPTFTVSVSADGVDTVSVPVNPDLAETTSAFALAHDLFVSGVTDALNRAEAAGSADISATYDAIKALEAGDPRITALLDDLCHADPAKGQIGKALATRSNFERWGRHYIPAYLSGQQNQWPVNFRDAGSAIYGGPALRALITLGDEKFVSIPPPTPTGNTSSYHGSGGSSGVSALAASSSIAATHSAAGPCFLGASLVSMYDGTRKSCDQIRPGDRVDGSYMIRCVIKTEVPYADIVELGDGPGGFTLWHPVFVAGRWEHPANLGTVKRVATDAIYNFVLDTYDDASPAERPGIMTINGIQTCTMAHGFTGPVIGHPYFGLREPGKRNILDDLQAQPGWATGYITWSNLRVSHDPATGMINGMSPV
jgi:Mg-chelatase subunit ChlD